MSRPSDRPDAVRHVDLLVTGGAVISLDPQRRIFADGVVAVDGERIVAVGRRADLEGKLSARRVLDARGGVVQPGFVDAHVHLGGHLGRGMLPDGLGHEREHEQYVPYMRALTPRDERCSIRLGLLEMLRNGTTCFADMGGDGRLIAEVAEAVGLRGMVCGTVWDRHRIPGLPHVTTEDALARFDDLAAALPQGPGRIWAGAGTMGMGRSSDRLLVELKHRADRLGVRMYLHTSFGEDDTREVRDRTGVSPVVHLDNLGILDANLQLVHAIRLTAEEVDLIAASGAHVVHCPAASLRAGMGAARIGRFPELLAAGVNVALGSDVGNFSDFLDIGRQAYLAATIHRETRGVVPTVSAEQALEMATLNGARALGAEAKLGSLEVGKLADLVIHSPDRPEWHPALDVTTTLIYAAQSIAVDCAVVAGEVVLEHGRATRVDEEAWYAEIDAAAGDLYQRMDYAIPQRWPVVT